MTASEYWEGDRNRRLEEELFKFGEEEFKGTFVVTRDEIARVTDLLRAYARHLNPSLEIEVKPFRFTLRGDTVVVTVTEEI